MLSFLSKLLRHKPISTASEGVSGATSAVDFDVVCEQAAAALVAKNYGAAVDLYGRAIALRPREAIPYFKRGNAQRMSGHLEAALASYQQALERDVEYAHAYCNRGAVQQALGLQSEALASYDAAIALDPEDAMAHYNRALLLQECDRWDDALASYERAIAVAPEFADAHYNRALALLYRGDFERGFPQFEWRWKIARRLAIGELRNCTQPLWLGEGSISGKRVLLYCEGGLGDTLQFCRYAALVAARGATVYLEIQPALLELLADLDGVSRLVGLGSATPDFDLRCPLMSLPLALGTTPETVPASTRYLHGDAARSARWRAEFEKRAGPLVGLVWSGNPNNPVDRRRSIRLSALLAHLPPGFQYICLQKELTEGDESLLASSSIFSSVDGGLQDFVATSSLCESLDLIISVDTSVAHLSAALGRPTWILLPTVPDWRWLADRDSSPWYPTAKLYRQRTAGDWNEVLERVAVDLKLEFGVD